MYNNFKRHTNEKEFRDSLFLKCKITIEKFTKKVTFEGKKEYPIINQNDWDNIINKAKSYKGYHIVITKFYVKFNKVDEPILNLNGINNWTISHNFFDRL